MKVAYEATALLGNRTGVGEFCYGALEALANMDELDVTAFAISYRRRHLLEEHLPANVAFGNWIMPARPLHKLWKRSEFPPVELWSGRIDLVHGTNFVVPPAKSAVRVVTVHDLTTLRFPEICNPPTLVFPEMIRRAAGSGAFIHTPSEFVRQEVIQNFHVDPDRVVAVHHGIPVLSHNRFVSEDAEVSALLGKRFLLAMGTIEPRKDFPLLVRAFGKIAGEFPDIHLVIAGQDGWGSTQLSEEIEKSKYVARIIRLGYVNPATRSWVMKNAETFVYPSVYEGFGFPPLEAMTFGTPVISSTAGSLPEVLGQDSALMFPPGDQSKLETLLGELLSDDETRAKYSEAGRRHSLHFSWEKCGQGLLHLYRSAVER